MPAKDFQVRGGGYYDSKTGSFGANGEWNGGGYKIQNSEANVNIGNGAFTGNAKVGSWDTGDSFGGGAGWDAKRGVAWAEGPATGAARRSKTPASIWARATKKCMPTAASETL